MRWPPVKYPVAADYCDRIDGTLMRQPVVLLERFGGCFRVTCERPVRIAGITRELQPGETMLILRRFIEKKKIGATTMLRLRLMYRRAREALTRSPIDAAADRPSCVISGGADLPIDLRSRVDFRDPNFDQRLLDNGVHAEPPGRRRCKQ